METYTGKTTSHVCVQKLHACRLTMSLYLVQYLIVCSNTPYMYSCTANCTLHRLQCSHIQWTSTCMDTVQSFLIEHSYSYWRTGWQTEVHAYQRHSDLSLPAVDNFTHSPHCGSTLAAWCRVWLLPSMREIQSPVLQTTWFFDTGKCRQICM